MKTFIIAAQSADGFIATSSKHPSHTWVSKEDRKFFQERTRKAGVMIMGRNTYEARGKPIAGDKRKLIVYTRKTIAFPDAKATKEAPALLLSRLEQEGYREAAIVGGSQIHTLFMEAGLVDKLYLTVEPLLFGSGISLFTKPLNVHLSLAATRKLNSQTILFEYEVIKRI